MSSGQESLTWLRQVVDKQVFDRKQEVVTAELCCSPDFPAFAGHFPGQPVLPAVIQLVVVRMLAGDLLQAPLENVQTGKMKFKGMIRPDERIQVRVVLEQINDRWKAVFKLKNCQSIVSSGTILFKARLE